MNGDSCLPTPQDDPRREGRLRALDGLLRELGRGAGPDEIFLAKVGCEISRNLEGSAPSLPWGHRAPGADSAAPSTPPPRVISQPLGQTQEECPNISSMPVARGPSRFFTPIQAWWGVAACLLIGLGIWTAGSMKGGNEREAAPLVAEAGAATQVTRGATRFTPAKGQKLAPGDEVSVPDDGRLVIDYADGSRVELSAGTQAVLQPPQGSGKTPGKRLLVRRGSVSAGVAKQPAGQPMIFMTPTAEATVLGTRLQLRVEETSTQLAVKDGAVRLRRLADDQAVTVSEGEQAVAGRESTAALVTTPIKGLLTSAETVPPGWIKLYSNDMETAVTYGYGGGTLTTTQKHGGLKSEQFAASGGGRWSNIYKTLPTRSVNSAFYRLWIFDNNNATQIYRLGIIFQKPDLTEVLVNSDYVFPAGANWTQISYDFTGAINTRISQGYTKIKTILVWAYNPGAYVPYYLDDVVVEINDGSSQ